MLRTKAKEELAQLYQVELRERGIVADDDYVAQVCGFIKERATFVKDFWDLSAYFFVAPTSYDEKTALRYWNTDTLDLMKWLSATLESVEPFTKENIEISVNEWIRNNELNTGTVMNAFRLCIVGVPKGPDMFEIAALLKKKEILRRMNSVLLKKNIIFVG